MIQYETADTRQTDSPARQRTIAKAKQNAPVAPERIAARMKEIEAIQAADAERLQAYGVRPWKPDPSLQRKIDYANHLVNMLERPVKG